MYDKISSWDKTMKTTRIYNCLYDTIAFCDKTMKIIGIYNYLYDMISSCPARTDGPVRKRQPPCVRTASEANTRGSRGTASEAPV